MNCLQISVYYSTLLSAGGTSVFRHGSSCFAPPKQEFIGTESVETLSPIVIDLKKLFEEGDQTQNIMLQDGDVLMVAAKKGTPFDAASAAQESEPSSFMWSEVW